jgi:cyclophilin family peptidyl-prolyl cis-trans isomerase
VANFVGYVNSGHYEGTVFHRVIPGFMAQGGGFTPQLRKKPTLPPILNEADNGLKNKRGTIAMARTNDPHSASTQFFINFSNNDMLDHSSKTTRGWGYAVFGKVIKGMEVVDKMATIPTRGRGPFRGDVPSETIEITGAQAQ